MMYYPLPLSFVLCWLPSVLLMQFNLLYGPSEHTFYVFTVGLRLYSRCTCLCSTEILPPSFTLKPPSPLCPHSSLHSTPVEPQKNVPSIPPYLPSSFPSLSISSFHQSISLTSSRPLSPPSLSPLYSAAKASSLVFQKIKPLSLSISPSLPLPPTSCSLHCFLNA